MEFKTEAKKEEAVLKAQEVVAKREEELQTAKTYLEEVEAGEVVE